MSYEPTNWKDGDLVTSAKLNKIEQGIAAGSGILVVHADENNRLDKTWQEIYDADLAVLIMGEDIKMTALIQEIGVEDNEYYANPNGIKLHFSASTPDDYPIVHTVEDGGGQA